MQSRASGDVLRLGDGHAEAKVKGMSRRRWGPRHKTPAGDRLEPPANRHRQIEGFRSQRELYAAPTRMQLGENAALTSQSYINISTIYTYIHYICKYTIYILHVMNAVDCLDRLVRLMSAAAVMSGFPTQGHLLPYRPECISIYLSIHLSQETHARLPRTCGNKPAPTWYPCWLATCSCRQSANSKGHLA